MTTRKRSAAVLALFCVLLVAGLWLGWHLARSDSDEGADKAVVEQSANPNFVQPVQAAAAVDTGPLPSLDAPLAETLPELQRRAAMGETGAACRLAAELSSCQWLPMRREQHVNWLVEGQRTLEWTAASKDPVAIANFTRRFERQSASRERGLAAQEARCAGVEPPDEPTMARHWYQAARAGSKLAQRYWASGRSFPPMAMLNSQAELAVYRAQAPGMARQLVREGDLPTTLALAGALAPLHSRRMNLLGQTMPEDAVESLALYLRLQDVLGEAGPDAGRLHVEVSHRIELLGELTSPAQRADAERRKREMAAWPMPRWESNYRALNLQAVQVPVPPVACHAEAGGQATPDFTRIRVGDGPL